MAYLVARTYERTLCGYSIDDAGSFTLIFNQPAHLGPVNAVASAGRFLFLGGNNEEILSVTFYYTGSGIQIDLCFVFRVFNLHTRVEVGSTMKHRGLNSL